MKHLVVHPSRVSGVLSIPPSKSQTLRALLFAIMAKGKSIINNPLLSPDVEAMIQAGCSIGAKIEKNNTQILIDGVGGKINYAENVIDAGNSGIVLRFFAAISALSSYPIVLTGDHSIRHNRPLDQLIRGLSQINVKAISTKSDGYAPIIIQGPMGPGDITLSGIDSQPVSALLIASSFSPYFRTIFVENPGETPWIDMTLSWLERLGIPCTHDNYQKFTIQGNASYDGFHYDVPGDFSSASFPIAAALVTQSEVTLEGMDFEDCQGDKEVISIFKKMGANIECDPREKKVKILAGSELRGIEIDINPIIDAIAIIAVVACYAKGTTTIYNGTIAKFKESNRIAAITTELKKMGARVTPTEDGLKIEGSPLKGAHFSSHFDHRIAMSLAVAALGAEGQSQISNSEVIVKTYPSFVKEFQKMGCAIDELNS